MKLVTCINGYGTEQVWNGYGTEYVWNGLGLNMYAMGM